MVQYLNTGLLFEYRTFKIQPLKCPVFECVRYSDRDCILLWAFCFRIRNFWSAITFDLNFEPNPIFVSRVFNQPNRVRDPQLSTQILPDRKTTTRALRVRDSGRDLFELELQIWRKTDEEIWSGKQKDFEKFPMWSHWWGIWTVRTSRKDPGKGNK